MRSIEAQSDLLHRSDGELGTLRLLHSTLDGIVFGLQGVHCELDHFVLGGIMYFGKVAHAPHLGLDSGQTCCPIHGLTMHLENACVSNAQGN